MKEKFSNIYAYLNQECSYHDIDNVVYDAANRLLDYLKSNTTFQLYNHHMNSYSRNEFSMRIRFFL